MMEHPKTMIKSKKGAWSKLLWSHAVRKKKEMEKKKKESSWEKKKEKKRKREEKGKVAPNFSSSHQIDRGDANFSPAKLFFANNLIFDLKNHFSQNRPKIHRFDDFTPTRRQSYFFDDLLI